MPQGTILFSVLMRRYGAAVRTILTGVLSLERFSILIVDDDLQVCNILRDLFNREGYATTVAFNGKEALERIAAAIPDLVISDIQMPHMDGFELLNVLHQEYPRIKHIMMTSYDIDQYIRHIRKHNVGNILVKGPDFNLVEVAAYVRALLNEEIFGLGRYFCDTTFNELLVQSYAQAKDAYHTITSSLSDKKGFFLELAIDELISNAIFHGALAYSDLPREQWADDILLSPENAVKVTWGVDEEKIGISIEDPKGNLKKTDVLKWLDSHHDDELSEEQHGRGFLLVRKLIDRLIINIDPGKRTECIIIQNFRQEENSYNKPLLVHEI
jgi:CheY-like chemotaxis protein/anti-sigma regulatory factor (Ser/Thr protein kinase)